METNAEKEKKIAQERENNCKLYEEKTEDLLEEWLEDDSEDESTEEHDGFRKDFKRMLRSCIGKEDASLDVPLPSEKDLLAPRYQFPKERYITQKNTKKLGYAAYRMHSHDKGTTINHNFIQLLPYLRYALFHSKQSTFTWSQS